MWVLQTICTNCMHFVVSFLEYESYLLVCDLFRWVVLSDFDYFSFSKSVLSSFCGFLFFFKYISNNSIPSFVFKVRIPHDVWQFCECVSCFNCVIETDISLPPFDHFLNLSTCSWSDLIRASPQKTKILPCCWM